MLDAPANPELPRRRPPAAPLFAATIFFSAGILLQTYTYKPPALYFFCTVTLVLCSLLALRFATEGHGALLAYAGAVLAFLPAGALFTAAHQSRPAPTLTLLQYASGDEVTLTGYVARGGSIRPGRDPHESLDFAVEQAQFDGDAPQAVTGKARLNLYVPGSRASFVWDGEEDTSDEAEAPPIFDYGQRLRIRGKLHKPTNFRNPGNMDYVGWLRGQGVAVLGSAKTTNIDLLPGLGGSRVDRIRWHARRSVLEHMERYGTLPMRAYFRPWCLENADWSGTTSALNSSAAALSICSSSAE